MDIGQKIKAIRSTKGLTQSQIAEQIGLDTSSYARIEKKGNKLSVGQLQSIAKILGVGVGELLGEGVKVSQSKEVESSLLRLKYFDNGRLALHNYLIMDVINFAFSKKKAIITMSENIIYDVQFMPYEVAYTGDKKDIFDEYIEQNKLLTFIDILKSCGLFDEEFFFERWNNHFGKTVPKYWKEETATFD